MHFTPEHVPAWNVSLWLVWRYRWGQVHFNTIPTIPSHWSQRSRHNSHNDTFHTGTEFPTRVYASLGLSGLKTMHINTASLPAIYSEDIWGHFRPQSTSWKFHQKAWDLHYEEITMVEILVSQQNISNMAPDWLKAQPPAKIAPNCKHPC